MARHRSPAATSSARPRAPRSPASRRQASRRRRNLVALFVVLVLVLPLLLSSVAVLAQPSLDDDPPAGSSLDASTPEVRRLQLLLLAAGFEVEVTSVIDDQTLAAVRSAQERFGFTPDGRVTASLIEVLSPTSGCSVAVLADTVDVGSAYRDRLTAATGCEVILDVAPGRELAQSWRCRSADGAAGVLATFGLARTGRVCPAPVAEMLRSWSETASRFDVIVVDAGRSDAERADPAVLAARWSAIATFTAAPTVVFATLGQAAQYDDALRSWCPTESRCVLAPAGDVPVMQRAGAVSAAVAAALAAAPPQ
jgi:peptidoglycan hydrolase-like protein with peptidoglycan-binding domain